LKSICIVGSGHVGLVTGACLAELGNTVICTDDQPEKIEQLKMGIIPFYEPGLPEIVLKNIQAGRLSFTHSTEEGAGISEIVFVCVGTPQKEGGEAGLLFVESAARRIARTLNSYKVIVEKSTVPVETGKWIRKTIEIVSGGNVAFDLVSNPEFLREGSAVQDFMYPDRIVIGVESQRARDWMVELYESLKAPMVVTNIETAELIKHASNSFLALKISYINAIANIAERTGADIVKIAEGMGYDKRIGRKFLDAGIGYGGDCFPKDVLALIKSAEDAGFDFELLKAVRKINENQRQLLVAKIKNALWNLNGKTIGILGLSYKPNTDDMRAAPSIEILRQLQDEGARIKAYDPHAMENCRLIHPGVEYCKSAYLAAENSDALVILTEWEEFRDLELIRLKVLLKQPVIIDGRNIFDPVRMKQAGFAYHGVGR
jgi:UDPglucose 6-dehydrogenase